MSKMKRFFDLVPLMLLWAMLSVLLWGWIFTFLTDAAPENKLTLFIDAQAVEDTALAVALEEGMGEGIRMVKVHPFSYAMLDDSTIRNADLYIVGASDVEEYREWFRPLPEELLDAGTLLELDGAAYGIRIYDAQTGMGAADEAILYIAPGEENEDHYLFLGSASLHVKDNEGAVDDEAVALARRLLALP